MARTQLKLLKPINTLELYSTNHNSGKFSQAMSNLADKARKGYFALKSKIPYSDNLSVKSWLKLSYGLGTAYRRASTAQALVSFKKYMPHPLPYFKVNICPFPLPHFDSIFFAYL